MIAWMLLPAAALAQDLYLPAPPPDSAFVRIVHGGQGCPGGPGRVGDKKLGAIGDLAITPYVAVPKGQAAAAVGTLEATLSFDAGEYYSVACAGEALRAVKDARNTNLAKASLLLYNLTDQPGARLTTGDGKVEVIGAVAAQAEGSQAVNAISTDLALWLGDTKITVLEGVKLERGRAYSAVITSSADGPKATWVENATR